jgi:hypothetical protein
VDRDRARRLHKEGWSLRKIADELGVSPMTAMRIVRRKTTRQARHDRAFPRFLRQLRGPEALTCGRFESLADLNRGSSPMNAVREAKSTGKDPKPFQNQHVSGAVRSTRLAFVAAETALRRVPCGRIVLVPQAGTYGGQRGAIQLGFSPKRYLKEQIWYRSAL